MTINVAMNCPRRVPVTIRPPFEPRANAVMARSISPASRTSIGRNSTPSDGASGLDCSQLPAPGCDRGIPQHRHSRHARSDLFQQLQPFSAHAIFELCEARGVAARARKALDEAGPDGVDDRHEHDRHSAGRLLQCREDGLPFARMTSGESATNSAAYLRALSALPAPQR